MSDNPNWKSILDVLPESLHSTVKPLLEQWDQGVNGKLDSVRKEYEGYKPLLDQNIDPEYLLQVLGFMEALEKDPKGTITSINQELNLGFNLDGTPAVNPDDLDLDDDDVTDISKNPQFVAMKTALDGFQAKYEEDLQARTNEQQLADFNKMMEQLETDNKDKFFDRDLVIPYIANGMDPQAAVDKVNDLLASKVDPELLKKAIDSQGNAEPGKNPDGTPVVIGAAGGAGAGTADAPINWGKASKNDINTYVEQLLQNTASGQ